MEHKTIEQDVELLGALARIYEGDQDHEVFGCDDGWPDNLRAAWLRGWERNESNVPHSEIGPAAGGIDAGLSLGRLEDAVFARLPHFKNGRGEPAHKEPDGRDWCLAQWCNAALGELGEAANLIKKIDRGDFTLDEARPALGHELADVLSYLVILARLAGIGLSQSTVEKFNLVSERVGSPVRL